MVPLICVKYFEKLLIDVRLVRKPCFDFVHVVNSVIKLYRLSTGSENKESLRRSNGDEKRFVCQKLYLGGVFSEELCRWEDKS